MRLLKKTHMCKWKRSAYLGLLQQQLIGDPLLLLVCHYRSGHITTLAMIHNGADQHLQGHHTTEKVEKNKIQTVPRVVVFFLQISGLR